MSITSAIKSPISASAAELVATMTDIFLGVNLDRHLAQFFDNGFGGLHNAMLEQHRVVASFQSLEAFIHDGVRQHSGSGCAITGDVIGLWTRLP